MNTRYKTVRRVEKAIAKVLHMISRTWDHREGRTCGNAFCDGLLIGGAPWLCYCCNMLRMRLEGNPWRSAPRTGDYVKFFGVATNHGHYIWPCVKYIYPVYTKDIQK